jgi:hypothetical protein
MATRTAKVLIVEAGAAKASQPGDGKIGADVLGEIATNGVHGRNDQQHARDIAEHEKPEQQLATSEIAPTTQESRIRPHRASTQESRGEMERSPRLRGIKPDPTYLNLTRVPLEEIYVLDHAAMLRARHTGKPGFLAGDKKCLRDAEALLTSC